MTAAPQVLITGEDVEDAFAAMPHPWFANESPIAKLIKAGAAGLSVMAQAIFSGPPASPGRTMAIVRSGALLDWATAPGTHAGNRRPRRGGRGGEDGQGQRGAAESRGVRSRSIATPRARLSPGSRTGKASVPEAPSIRAVEGSRPST